MTEIKRFLAVPSHRPIIFGWCELLAGTYIAYGLIMAMVLIVNYSVDGFRPTVLALLISPLALLFLVLIATRRGNSIAFWVSFALLMTPTLNLVRGKVSLDFGAGFFHTLPQLIPIILSLVTVSFLLHPEVRAWIALRRAELRQHKDGDGNQTINSVTLVESEQKGFQHKIEFTADSSNMEFIDTWWPKDAVRQESSIDRQWKIEIPNEQKIPLILQLRKANKDYSVPKEDVDSELVKSIRAIFQSKPMSMQDLLIFLVGGGVNGRLLETVGKSSLPISMTIQMLDKSRAREKVDVHFNGEAQYLNDILRQAYVFTDVDQYHLICKEVNNSEKWDVVETIDRFKKPAENGYRDLKFKVKLKENGHIATLRFVHASMLDSQYKALESDTELAIFQAKKSIGENERFIVIAMDNFNYWESVSRTLISGFPDLESAQKYARLRLEDSIQQLKKSSDSDEELLRNWILFGETSFAYDLVAGTSGYAMEEQVKEIIGLDEFTDSAHWEEYGNKFPLEFVRLPDGAV